MHFASNNNGKSLKKSRQKFLTTCSQFCPNLISQRIKIHPAWIFDHCSGPTSPHDQPVALMFIVIKKITKSFLIGHLNNRAC